MVIYRAIFLEFTSELALCNICEVFSIEILNKRYAVEHVKNVQKSGCKSKPSMER